MFTDRIDSYQPLAEVHYHQEQLMAEAQRRRLVRAARRGRRAGLVNRLARRA